MKKQMYGLVLGLFLLGCKPITARTPLKQNSGSFVDTFIEINKDLNAREYSTIKSLIKNSDYKRSDFGFWYKYDIKNTKSLYTPKFGDLIHYKYAVKNLNGNYIYPPDETVEKTYYVEQQDLFSGLREGLKLMKNREKMTFIFPSQLAYGFYGDQAKIGSNTPLIYEVTVVNIQQN